MSTHGVDAYQADTIKAGAAALRLRGFREPPRSHSFRNAARSDRIVESQQRHSVAPDIQHRLRYLGHRANDSRTRMLMPGKDWDEIASSLRYSSDPSGGRGSGRTRLESSTFTTLAAHGSFYVAEHYQGADDHSAAASARTPLESVRAARMCPEWWTHAPGSIITIMALGRTETTVDPDPSHLPIDPNVSTRGQRACRNHRAGTRCHPRAFARRNRS
jgi:hypothetical protein